jgi:hypothetical protein
LKASPYFGYRRRALQHLVAFATLLGFSGGVFAACTTYYCQGTISLLYVTDTGAYVQLSGGLTGLTNCTPESGVYLTLPKTNGNYSSLYALLLLAKAQGSIITIRTNDGSAGCTVAYITTP